MTINQISVFLENKFGRLNEILSMLRNENIRIVASTVADTSDYGILRIITTDQNRAFRILKENNVSADMNEVLAISLNSQAGVLSETIDKFAQAGISIEYMYSFALCGKAVLVLRSNAMDVANDVARKNNMNSISETELVDL